MPKGFQNNYPQLSAIVREESIIGDAWPKELSVSRPAVILYPFVEISFVLEWSAKYLIECCLFHLVRATSVDRCRKFLKSRHYFAGNKGVAMVTLLLFSFLPIKVGEGFSRIAFSFLAFLLQILKNLSFKSFTQKLQTSNKYLLFLISFICTLLLSR